MPASPVRHWWRNLTYAFRDGRTAALTALLSACLALALSWLGDALFLAGLGGRWCIANALIGSPCQQPSWLSIIALIAVIVLFALGLWWLLRRRMPVEVRGMQAVTPRAVLLVSVSILEPKWRLFFEPQGSLLCDGGREWTLGSTFEQALTSLNNAGSDWPWHQLLRGLNPHRGTLRQLVLLTTPESRAHLDVLIPWLRAMLADVVINECPCTGRDVDVDANRISNRIKQLRQEGYREEQQIIDISGANKVLSIAATLATLDNDCTFQYVRAQQNAAGQGEVLECYSSVKSSNE